MNLHTLPCVFFSDVTTLSKGAIENSFILHVTAAVIPLESLLRSKISHSLFGVSHDIIHYLHGKEMF